MSLIIMYTKIIMKIITTLTTYLTVALLAVSLALPGVVRADAWDWDYSGDWGGSLSDTSSGNWGSSWSNDTGNWGSSWSDTGSWDSSWSADTSTGNWDSSWSSDTYDTGTWGSTWSSDTYSGNWDSSWSDTGNWDSSWSADTSTGNWDSSWSSDIYDTGTWGSSWSNDTYSGDGEYAYESPIYENSYESPVYTSGYESPSYNWGYGSAQYNYAYTPIVYTTGGNYTSNWVYEPPVVVSKPDAPNPVCRLDLSDTSIERGDDVIISWDASNATRVVIADSDDETLLSTSNTSDSRVIYPRESTAFTMRAYNAQGEIDICTESIDVDDEDTTTSGSRPVCELRVSDTTIRRGMPVLLTWGNTRAREMVIRDQFGNAILSADTNTSRSPNSGRQTVIPNQDVTYTMRVTNNNGSDTCSVSVEAVDTGAVTGGITVDRVPLANVPYTGFDAGPTMMALFYLLLGIWAVAIAYYVMQRKYGVAVPVVATETVAAAIAAPIAPVAAHPFDLPTDSNFEKMFGGIAEEPVFSLTQYAAQEHIFVTDEVIAAIQTSAHTAFAQKAMFDALVVKARGVYPTEHGWLTIDSTRYATLNA